MIYGLDSADPHERATSATLPAGVPFSALARIAPGPGWRLVTTVVAPSPGGDCVVAWWWDRETGASVKA